VIHRMIWVAAVLLGCSAMTGSAGRLTIVYTNDLHLRFERLAAIEAAIAEERARDPDLLVLDAGDAWQDFRRPLAAVWGADEMVAWMNRVGYSAMAIGNHDLYWGPRRLAALVEAASFPVVCANLTASPGFEVPFRPAVAISAGGLSVLIVGLVTDEYFPYGEYPWLRTIDPATAVTAAIRASEPADAIIVLCHLPLSDAATLARVLPEVDLFVTGHSHEATEVPLRVGDALLVQAGAFGASVGRLTADVEPGTGRLRIIDHQILEMPRAPVDLRRGARVLAQFAAMLVLAAMLLIR